MGIANEMPMKPPEPRASTGVVNATKYTRLPSPPSMSGAVSTAARFAPSGLRLGESAPQIPLNQL